MPLPKPITWKVHQDGMLDAIQWASRKLFYSIDRPGMNPRSMTERLDDKIMGDVATAAVLEYLAAMEIPAAAYDQVRTDRFQSPDPGWDIVVGENALAWVESTKDPKTPVGLTTASVRSSRLPRRDSLGQAVRTRDFKIFAPAGKSIEDCIAADIEVQVYYDYHRSQLGNKRIDRAHVQQCARDRAQGEEIIKRLDIKQRYGTCYLTAWNRKASIVQHSRTLSQPFWSSFGKRMWIAPLRLGKDMKDLQELR